jgi:trans-aconitate methyltransferase
MFENCSYYGLTSAAMTSAAHDPALAALVRSWDAQQAAYIAEREQRFTVMLDVIELVTGGGPITVLDLACGPGSLSRRVLARFPDARVTAVDLDPVLLALADHDLAEFGDRYRIVEGDLTGRAWRGALDGTIPTVAVSTTALHWLAADDLAALYMQLAELLPGGGLFLNGDHLQYDASTPTLVDVAARHDAATQARAHASGVRTWDQWWADAAAHPRLGPLVAERDARFADRPENGPVGVGVHLDALRRAGFREVSTVWQLLDDHIVFARR